MKNKIIIGDLEIFKKKKIQYLIENNLWPLSKNDLTKAEQILSPDNLPSRATATCFKPNFLIL